VEREDEKKAGKREGEEEQKKEGSDTAPSRVPEKKWKQQKETISV
jgi:hypothetical protein